MGLNIGAHVKAQSEGFMCEGRNPKGTPEEVEERFFAFLNEKFPEGGFGGGWVSFGKRFDAEKDWWDFDVRMFSYGADFCRHYESITVMYLAIFEFVLGEFSYTDWIESETYYSG